MKVYIDQKIITWRRTEYHILDVLDGSNISEKEVIEILKDEYEFPSFQDDENGKFNFIDSQILFDVEEDFYDGMTVSKEMIIVLPQEEKTIKQTI